MKYVSFDLETSSLVPHLDHILMVSMVVEDSSKPEVPLEDLPHFTCYVNHPVITGQPFALSMNAWILDILSGKTGTHRFKIYEGNTWIEDAHAFLGKHFTDRQKITLAGKSVGTFDLQFLPVNFKTKFDHRVLDPTCMFFDWAKDSKLPGFDKCLQRAGIDTKVQHCAYQDALDVIRLLRTTYTSGPINGGCENNARPI